MTLAGVFDMARTAGRRESLELVMSRGVVTRQARLVGHRSTVGGVADVAYVAARRQHCVRRREWPICVNLLVSRDAGICNPAHGKSHKPERKIQSPSLDEVG